MKLKRLIIQGFKSFKDRTIIHFDEGITGIVGPNGCGKSNIVDALFWVMGEQSAKHLRGSSMQDVIFAGSSKYNPGSWAEVSLVLENDSGKHIHIGQKVSCPSEIQLTRKLYRNGDSEYRINGHQGRLRDIQEVFMDTGAGSKSYSIIAQGEINRLVQAKPEERRMMIEEVAGITKFKARKKESLRKIDQTQANISRLNDLKNEIEKNLRSLKHQAEKAEKAKILKEKIKRNDLITNSHKVYDNLKKFKEGKGSISQKKLDLVEGINEKDSIELIVQEEKIHKEENLQKVEIIQDEFNKDSKELAADESKFQGLCKLKTEKETLLKTLVQEKVFSEQEHSNRNEKKEEIEERLKKLEEFDGLELDFEEEEEVISSLKENLDEKDEDLKHLQGCLEADIQDLLSIDQEIFKNDSKIEEYSKNLEDLNIEIEEVEKRYSGFSNKIVEERHQVQCQKEELNKLDEEEKKLSLTVGQLKEQYELLKIDYNKKTKEIIRCETTLHSLIDLKNSLEGAGQGSSKFIKDNEGKFKIFGHIIECEEKYAKGIQVILGDLLNTIVSREGSEKDFFSWFKSNEDQGLEVYYPLYKDFKRDDVLSGELKARLELSGFKGVKGISDLLKIEEGFGHGIADLLSGFYLVEKIELCLIEQISKDLNFKAIVSLDGKTLVKKCEGGPIINVNPGNTTGMVEQNNKINGLEESLKDLKLNFKNLEEKLNETEIEFKKNKENYEIKSGEKLKIREEYRILESGLEIKLENHTFNSSRLKKLQEKKQDYSEARLSYLEAEEKIGEAKEEKEEKIEELKLRFEEVEEDLKIERENYNVKKEEFLRKKLEVESFDEKLKTFKDQHNDLVNQVEKCKTRILVHNKSIDENQLIIGKMVVEIQDLELKNKNRVEELKDREDLLGSLKDDFAELLLKMEGKEKKLKTLSSQINRFEKEILEFEAKSERFLVEEEEIVKNIFEKYQVDLRSSVGNFLNFISEDYEGLNNLGNLFFQIDDDGEEKSIEKGPYEFVKKYGQDIKICQSKLRNLKNEYNTLGEVNWQAIEDYNRQKVRSDFLREQEDELNKSLVDLNEAIFQIDEKSKERFKVAFEEVNERFVKVFPIMFGGGEGSLRVTTRIDDPDAGIDIIARPPGKKMQNINLMSGGEKALTAVSLIFSIFLVKPSPFCLLDEVDAPLDDANVGRFNDLLGAMSSESQFILITHNKKTMELNDRLYGVTMQEPGISKAMSIQLQ